MLILTNIGGATPQTRSGGRPELPGADGAVARGGPGKGEARISPILFNSRSDLKGGSRRLGGPDVPMMQPAYLRHRDDRTSGSFLSVSMLRRIAVQGHVAAGFVVMVDVASQHSSQL